MARFASDHGWPIMLKAARGGYDGKGVWPVADRPRRRRSSPTSTGTVVVEELVPLDAELAVMVARRPSGCVGGLAGGRDGAGRRRLPRGAGARAPAARGGRGGVGLGQQVAEIAGAVGVMAVELFWSRGRLLVNEVATRPHNSGHWTIEGAVTSQFENHVRAVLDLPLGSTAPQHAQVASVNVFGGPDGRGSVAAAGPGPGRRGRARAPVWQGGAAGTQTGARDRVRRRRRAGPRPRLVGGAGARHARARRASRCRRRSRRER